VETLDELRSRLTDVRSAILTEYRGLSVEQLTQLRRELRNVSAEYKVLKNRLAKIAVQGSGLDGLAPYFKGPTAVAFTRKDPVALAKTLQTFQRQNPELAITAGCVEGAVIPAAEVKALADLPTRELLLGQVAGAFQAPLANLVYTLEGMLRSLVSVLDQLRAKREAS
jgi:large subunit ribosomal protein L10